MRTNNTSNEEYVVLYGDIICFRGNKTDCYSWKLERDKSVDKKVLEFTSKTRWVITRADLAA